MSIDIDSLAQRFLDATVNKWGTDEAEVNEILRERHSLSDYQREEFDFTIATNKQTNKQLTLS